MEEQSTHPHKEFEVDSELQGDYGESVFISFCKKNHYAYTRLENIYNSLTPNNILTFKFGFKRLRVELPESVVDEIRKVCKPIKNPDNSPGFVFDFLTLSLYNYFDLNELTKVGGKVIQLKPITRRQLKWVEVKTGNASLSPNQIEMKKHITLPFNLFRVPAELPEKVKIIWEELYEFKDSETFNLHYNS